MPYGKNVGKPEVSIYYLAKKRINFMVVTLQLAPTIL